MKILITGGGGFLGFRLARTLLARGKLGGRRSLDHAAGWRFPPARKTAEGKGVTGDVSDEQTIAGVCTPDTTRCSILRRS
jgi:nucleoside-diphosphate-sugar epimerase